MPDDFPEDFNPYAAPKADMRFPETPRSGFAVGADAGILRDSPARVPFWRGLRWPAAVWSVVFAWPAYWLPMGLALTVALVSWTWVFAMPLHSDALFFGVMPLPAACVLGPARRHVLGRTEAGSDVVMVWARALVFCLLLAGLVWGLAMFWNRLAHALRLVFAPPQQVEAAVVFGALNMVALFAVSFALTFWVLLAQILAETRCPSPARALLRAGQALGRNLPACVLCALALACAAVTVFPFAALGADKLHFASAAAKQVVSFLCLLVPLPFFVLEILLVPWLMARDMFADTASTSQFGVSGKIKNRQGQ